MPKVSILIPSYNAAHFLPVSIESALSQTYQDFEIIIVDDGSNDNTKEIVRSFIDKYPHKIFYFRQENKGIAIARNTGIAQSQGEYLALLDADDQWLPCHLEEGVKILDSDISVGLVHGKVSFIDRDNKEISTPKRDLKFLKGHIFNNIFLRKADIVCPTVIFRRSCCEQVGGFDVNLSRLGCEDRELWLRIAQKYKIIYIDKIVSNYRITPQSVSRNLKKMTEARLYVIDKYCPKDDLKKRSLRHKALAKVFRDIGDEFLLKEEYTAARQEYSRAIRYDPLAFWPSVNWIKAVLKQLGYSLSMYNVRIFLRQIMLILLDLTGFNMIFRSLNSNKAIILWYHGICDDNFKMLKGYDERHIPRSLFRRQLVYLISKGYQFATMSELVLLLKEKRKINKIVVLTFDDGFRNVVDNAYPIMKELNAKGCIYLVSNLIDEQNLLWTDLIEMVVRINKSKEIEFLFNGEKIKYSLSSKGSCESAIKNIKDKLRSIPDIERKDHLKQFNIDDNDIKDIPKEFLTSSWVQIKDLEKSILEAGSHTRNHPNCTNLILEEEFESELKGSKEDIEKQLGYCVDNFCYPAGSYDGRVINYIKKYAYRSATSIIPGFNDAGTSLFELKRIPTNENFCLFKAMVSGSFFFISDALQWIKGGR